ncbi:MAG: low molecular weight phosphatase family protein [Acidobacteria bacterium]|nr:low molecular weight phosphatase family protein [Acidobacteriota bacterium]
MTPKRVLFVCIGNLCRSQMAEGFARARGADVVAASSAGVYAGTEIPYLTHEAMGQRGVDTTGQIPKQLIPHFTRGVDLIINMSGMPLPRFCRDIASEDWVVADPYGSGPESYAATRDDVEARVGDLIARLAG